VRSQGERVREQEASRSGRLLFAGKDVCLYPPPNFDWFDLIEYYAFRTVLLISFLWTLYQVLKHKLKG
jgi:hypothetical protein